MNRAYWKKEKLEDFQNKKLRKIVRYAFDKVPLYHRKFKEMGVRPEDIKTLNDLSRLPIVRKTDIRENPVEAVSSGMRVENLKMLCTSGSTGQPLRVYITSAEDEYRKAKHLRANISCGQRPRDKWVTITRHFESAGGLQQLLRIYTPNAVSVFDDVVTQIARIEALKPALLDGYSNSLLLLAKEIEKRKLRTINPRLIIGGAELIADSSRELIEKAFGCPFYDQYAIVELERIAWQCPQKTGYHIDADSILAEFLDENGEQVAPGETGQIVCTSLFNYAMPFIRYDVGDFGSAPEETSCPCDRTFPLMKMVQGRKDSLLVFPDGRVLAPFAFIAAMMTFRLYSYIDIFRVIQRKKHRLVFKIKVLEDHVLNKSLFEKELLAHLEKVLKVDTNKMTMQVEFVNDLPLDSGGKFGIVVSELA